MTSSLVRHRIPLVCALAIAVTVVGVKALRREATRPALVWYGNAVHPYITEVRSGVEAFARDTGTPVHCTLGQEWTQDNQNVNVEALLDGSAFSLTLVQSGGASAPLPTRRGRDQARSSCTAPNPPCPHRPCSPSRPMSRRAPCSPPRTDPP